jgi:hypothetical protein
VLHAVDFINQVATEKRNLKTMKVKLLDLLYLTIVHVFVLAHNIISINMYTTILICAFLILLFSVKCVSIYAVPLICHNSEYRATDQLFLNIHLSEFSMIEKSDPGSDNELFNVFIC